MCLISFFGCLDKIDLNSPLSSSPFLIIDGKITVTSQQSKLRILVSLSATPSKPTSFVRVSEAFVINSKGVEKPLIDNRDGSYEYFGNIDFNFEIGEKYKVKLVAFTKEIYESEFVAFYEGAKIDSLTYEWEKGALEDKIIAVVETKTNNIVNNNILKWDVIQSYQLTEQLWGDPPGRTCYATAHVDLFDVALFDARQKGINQPIRYKVSEKPLDSKFAEGYYFTIVQEAIDVNTYNYFEAYNELLIRDGNIFESPAGTIPTNFKCTSHPSKIVLGYFYATSQDTARLKVDHQDVGNPKMQCPMPPTEFNPCPTRACCDCLSLKGSSLYKPHFWK